jgi:hypothetical protein
MFIGSSFYCEKVRAAAPPGDHGHFGKVSPFESAAHVPLIVAGEGLPLKGVEEHRPVPLGGRIAGWLR